MSQPWRLQLCVKSLSIVDFDSHCRTTLPTTGFLVQLTVCSKVLFLKPDKIVLMFVTLDVRDTRCSWNSMFGISTFRDPLLVTLFRHSVAGADGSGGTTCLASRLSQLFCCCPDHSVLIQAPSVIDFVLYSTRLALMHFVLPTVGVLLKTLAYSVHYMRLFHIFCTGVS
jgi:hypothetical protein